MSGGPSPRLPLVERWDDDERLAVARLSGLHHMTVGRLRSLVADGGPLVAVERLERSRSGAAADPADHRSPLGALVRRRPDLLERWRQELRHRTVELLVDQLAECDLRVIGPADAEWPPPLRVDPEPPVALFVRGHLDDRRRVAIVGTRNPTERGRRLAARFGHELASADVSVVSGLALGVDGAAHRGALAAERGSVIGIVANGHDRPYPRRHTALWREVAARGAVVSEWPPGTAPDAYRFPQRNRLIAGVSEVVVVVESRETGGSLLTARAAAERDVQVMAVPGPPDVRASLGTNHLVQEGAALVVDVDDILLHLGLDHSRTGTQPRDPRPRPDADHAVVLDHVRSAPTTVERLARRTGLDLGTVALRLARLERSGWVFEVDGWFEALDEWSLLARRPIPSESGEGR